MPREIRSEILIDAPATTVWKKLVDLPRYGEWNPFIRSISGTIEEGERLSVTLHPPGLEAKTFTPQVVKVVGEQEIRWIGRVGVPGLLDGEHALILDPAPGAKTQLIQHETFSGLLVPFVWSKIEGPTRRGFEAMNQALKKALEGG